MNYFATRRLSIQFTLLLLVSIGGMLSFANIILDALGNVADAPSARALVNSGLAQYDYVTKYKGLYLRHVSGDWESMELAGRYSNRMIASETLPSGEVVSATFLRKSPAGAVTELAAEVSKHDPSRRLRLLSGDGRADAADSAQIPNNFEMRAIAAIKKSGEQEFSGVDGVAQTFYVIRLVTAPGHPELYLSASVPHTTPSLLWAVLPPRVWFAGFSLIGLLVLLVWLSHHFVVYRIQRLANYAQSLLTVADDNTMGEDSLFRAHDGSSANEIHRLSFALKALANSARYALRLTNARRAP